MAVWGAASPRNGRHRRMDCCWLFMVATLSTFKRRSKRRAERSSRISFHFQVDADFILPIRMGMNWPYGPTLNNVFNRQLATDKLATKKHKSHKIDFMNFEPFRG